MHAGFWGDPHLQQLLTFLLSHSISIAFRDLITFLAGYASGVGGMSGGESQCGIIFCLLLIVGRNRNVPRHYELYCQKQTLCLAPPRRIQVSHPCLILWVSSAPPSFLFFLFFFRKRIS